MFWHTNFSPNRLPILVVVNSLFFVFDCSCRGLPLFCYFVSFQALSHFTVVCGTRTTIELALFYASDFQSRVAPCFIVYSCCNHGILHRVRSLLLSSNNINQFLGEFFVVFFVAFFLSSNIIIIFGIFLFFVFNPIYCICPSCLSSP